jgi:hypothetical protein
MRRIALPLAIAALLAAAPMAYAHQMKGKIASIDQSKKTITLANGKTFKIPTSLKPSSYHKGEKVEVVYSKEPGKVNDVEDILPAHMH